MSAAALSPTDASSSCRTTFYLQTVRPAMLDLRFKGEADVLATPDGACLCLGRYELTRLNCTPLDVPSLSRLFQELRVATARRLLSRRLRERAKNRG
jgi:hypothetical protein